MIFEKPAEGAPCNRCGWCCVMQPCAIDLDLLTEYAEKHREDAP
jgi:hypothetical protein